MAQFQTENFSPRYFSVTWKGGSLGKHVEVPEVPEVPEVLCSHGSCVARSSVFRVRRSLCLEFGASMFLRSCVPNVLRCYGSMFSKLMFWKSYVFMTPCFRSLCFEGPTFFNGSVFEAYVSKALRFYGSMSSKPMFRRSYVFMVLCSRGLMFEGPLFLEFCVPKVLRFQSPKAIFPRSKHHLYL